MNSKKQSYGFETRAIHAGAAPDAVTGARNTPIYQTTAYVFDNHEHAASLFNLQDFGFIYSRLTNPTVSVLEERIANIENGRGAVASSSGHSAQLLALFPLLESGEHFIASKWLYGGSITQFTKSFKRFGWDCDIVDPRNTDNIISKIKPETKCIFLESISNPEGIILDIEKISNIANNYQIPLVVDNTMATPFLFNPINWGADIVTHSLTKFLCGHGTTMGGIVVESGKFDWQKSGKFPSLTEPTESYHGLRFAETFGDFAYTMKLRADVLRDLGSTLAPLNAFNILTSIETLHLRMERHVQNALSVAKFLNGHEKVQWVSYPGLESSPYYNLSKKYFPKGTGSVFTIGLKGGYKSGIDLVESVKIFSHVANVGDTRSIITHPASTTHNQLSDEEKKAAGLGPEVIRLSIGLETLEDLMWDLDQGLK